jgi:hypothetical protein
MASAASSRSMRRCRPAEPGPRSGRGATVEGVEPSALEMTAGVELLTWLSVVPHLRALLVEAL